MFTDPINEQVAALTESFHLRAREARIFERIERQLHPSPFIARVVGALWYQLSLAIVDLLCLALAQLHSVQLRHLVVQTTYEELGGPVAKDIHSELLRDCMKLAGVTEDDIKAQAGNARVRASLDRVLARVRSSASDAEIAGLLLGMEIIAMENIHLVLRALTHAACPEDLLRETGYMKDHLRMEPGHIDRAVRAYLALEPTAEQEEAFDSGLASALGFWREYWDAIAETLQGNDIQSVSEATNQARVD